MRRENMFLPSMAVASRATISRSVGSAPFRSTAICTFARLNNSHRVPRAGLSAKFTGTPRVTRLPATTVADNGRVRHRMPYGPCGPHGSSVGLVPQPHRSTAHSDRHPRSRPGTHALERSGLPHPQLPRSARGTARLFGGGGLAVCSTSQPRLTSPPATTRKVATAPGMALRDGRRKAIGSQFDRSVRGPLCIRSLALERERS